MFFQVKHHLMIVVFPDHTHLLFLVLFSQWSIVTPKHPLAPASALFSFLSEPNIVIKIIDVRICLRDVVQ